MVAANLGPRRGEHAAGNDDERPAGRRGEPLGVGGHAKRVALACVLAVVSLNLWTGGPLLALWIGSRVQGSGPPSMAAVAAVVGSLAIITLLLVKALSGIGHAYDQLVGKPPGPREQAPWLRSLRGERPSKRAERAGLSVPERVLVLSVVAAILAFEVWFFFFSGSPIGGGSGR